MFLSAKFFKWINLGSVFLKTACPYPGTTLPDPSVILTYSYIKALLGLCPLWWFFN